MLFQFIVLFTTVIDTDVMLSFSNISLDVQELQHAVSAQQIASPHPYKKDYKEQIVGKGPHDPTIGYPEHDHHKKVGELTSSVGFCCFLYLYCILCK